MLPEIKDLPTGEVTLMVPMSRRSDVLHTSHAPPDYLVRLGIDDEMIDDDGHTIAVGIPQVRRQ